jgi:hypothetical protein
MRTACLFLLGISCVALIPATGDAAPQQQSSSGGASVTADGARDSKQAAHSGEVKTQGRAKTYGELAKGSGASGVQPLHASGSPAAATSRPSLASNNHRSPAANASNPRTPALSSASAVQEQASANSLRARTQNTARPATSSPSVTRHRGVNPPVVNGSAGLARRNTGTINGTNVKHKP